MKKLFYLFLFIGLTLASCNKPEDLATEVEVSFKTSMGGSNFKAGGDQQPTFDCNTDAATYAKLTINGEVYKVDLIRDGDQMYTQSIKLPVLSTGTYTLTSFILYDALEVAVLAVPVNNAEFADFVTQALPLDLNVGGFVKVDVPIQVLCYTPTDIVAFGYSWFSFEEITVRELCFFGDICLTSAKMQDYIDYNGGEGTLYKNQVNGIQHDMPAIFKVEVSMWNEETADWDTPIVSEDNELHSDNSDWYGEGSALCVQYPDYVGDDRYKIELLVYQLNDQGAMEYVSMESFDFTDSQGFPYADNAGDGVIDFVIGDCVPGADIKYPKDPPPVACEECDKDNFDNGFKLDELTIEYTGDSPATINIKEGSNVLGSPISVTKGDTFILQNLDALDNNIKLYIGTADDGNLDATIHTSCSKPVGVNMEFGSFKIIAGKSTTDVLLCELPIPTEETAYAFDQGDGMATEFTSLQTVNSKWGWSNGPYAKDTKHTLLLYAGAGQNILSNGTVVGTVEVEYKTDGKVKVKYEAYSGFEFNNLQFYVGYDALQDGNEGNAPGTYPNKEENLSGGARDGKDFEIPGFDGTPVYVIAHADVVGFFSN